MKRLGGYLLRTLLVAAVCVPLFAAFLLSGAVCLFASVLELLVGNPVNVRRHV